MGHYITINNNNNSKDENKIFIKIIKRRIVVAGLEF